MDRYVLHEPVLDLNRADPEAADLHHVVDTTLVDVAAVFVPVVAIAGGEPAQSQLLGGPLALMPVVAQGAANPQLAGHSVGDGLSLLVAQFDLVPVDGVT